jgi:hypothetical protein
VPDLDVEQLAAMPIAFVAQVATRWRDGRAFLIGDAAHRMPPFGGRGMNTAIADAYNLAWKLAWVIQDVAAPALLDSFEAERVPVGRANVELAVARYRGDGPQGSPDGLLEDIGYRYQSPTIAMGAGQRAPHAWLEHDRGRVSTVDLFGDRLVLLANGAGADWRMAVRSLRGASTWLPLAAFGPPMPALPAPPVSVVAIGGALVDGGGSFAQTYGLEPGGAVLVRPDGHIAARWTTAPADHGAALADAVAMALGQRVVDARVSQPEALRVPAGGRTAEPSPA